MAGLDGSVFVAKRAAMVAQAAAMPGYADHSYWLARYAESNNEPFDWYLKWMQLKDHVLPLLTQESKILVVGCGTSTLSEDLYAEGFVNVSSIDWCEQVIEQLAAKHQDKSSVEYEATPVHLLPKDYPNWVGRFDVAIDKGTFDCLACGKDKWTNAKEALFAVREMIKPKGGVYVCLSHASPELRQPLLLGPTISDATVGKSAGDPRYLGVSKAYGWRVEHRRLPRPLVPDVGGDVKGKAPAKGAPAIEMAKSEAFNQDEHCYHLYVCQRQ